MKLYVCSVLLASLCLDLLDLQTFADSFTVQSRFVFYTGFDLVQVQFTLLISTDQFGSRFPQNMLTSLVQ